MSVYACNTLCLATKKCVKFEVGTGKYAGRCDLYREKTCSNPHTKWKFKWFYPVYSLYTPNVGSCPPGATCFKTSDGTKYASYKDKDINGGDTRNFKGKSQLDCAEACSKYSKCKSFDWVIGKCWFSTTEWTS